MVAGGWWMGGVVVLCCWLWSCEQWAMDGERVVIVGVGGGGGVALWCGISLCT